MLSAGGYFLHGRYLHSFSADKMNDTLTVTSYLPLIRSSSTYLNHKNFTPGRDTVHPQRRQTWQTTPPAYQRLTANPISDSLLHNCTENAHVVIYHILL